MWQFWEVNNLGTSARLLEVMGCWWKKIMWALSLFEVKKVLEGHPVGRAGWRTLQLPLSQVVFSTGLGVRDGCWSHSGGLSLAGMEMQRGSATLGWGKKSFVSRWSLLMLHSLSARGPERSLLTFWEPLRSGAPAEQPRESPYNWGQHEPCPCSDPHPRASLHGGLCAAWRGGPSPACPRSRWPRSTRDFVTCSLSNVPLQVNKEILPTSFRWSGIVFKVRTQNQSKQTKT